MNKDDAETYHTLTSLRLENALLRKENEELKERWRKTHDATELQVQLARTVEELNELKRQVNDLCVSNERYAKNLAQKL